MPTFSEDDEPEGAHGTTGRPRLGMPNSYRNVLAEIKTRLTVTEDSANSAQPLEEVRQSRYSGISASVDDSVASVNGTMTQSSKHASVTGASIDDSMASMNGITQQSSMQPSSLQQSSCVVESDTAKGVIAWMNEEVITHLLVMNRKLDSLVIQARRSQAKSGGGRKKSLYDFEIGRPSVRSVATTRTNTLTSCTQEPIHEAPSVDQSASLQSSSMIAKPAKHARIAEGSHLPAISFCDETAERRPGGARNSKETSVTRIADHIALLRYRRGATAVKIWRFLENPYSSAAAQVYACLIPVLVVASVFVSFWQTVHGCPLIGVGGEILQTFFEALFGIEFVVRLMVCPDRCSFCTNIFNYIDFLSASPLLIRAVYAFMYLLGSKDHSVEDILSNLAVVPVLRLLKLTRRFEKFQLLFDAFLLVVEALPVLLYTLTVIALIFAALVYAAEPRDNIPNLPKALWFVIVTMTTVGYGDTMVTTTPGYFIMSLLMVISGMYMAMPIGIVGSAFSQVWNDRDRLLLMQRIRIAFLQEGFDAEAMEDIVQMFDADEDGLLDLSEFRLMLEAMHIRIGDNRVEMLRDSLDTNNDGTINIQELMEGLFPRKSYTRVGGLVSTLSRSKLLWA